MGYSPSFMLVIVGLVHGVMVHAMRNTNTDTENLVHSILEKLDAGVPPSGVTGDCGVLGWTFADTSMCMSDINQLQSRCDAHCGTNTYWDGKPCPARGMVNGDYGFCNNPQFWRTQCMCACPDMVIWGRTCDKSDDVHMKENIGATCTDDWYTTPTWRSSESLKSVRCSRWCFKLGCGMHSLYRPGDRPGESLYTCACG